MTEETEFCVMNPECNRPLLCDSGRAEEECRWPAAFHTLPHYGCSIDGRHDITEVHAQLGLDALPQKLKETDF